MRFSYSVRFRLCQAWEVGPEVMRALSSPTELEEGWGWLEVSGPICHSLPSLSRGTKFLFLFGKYSYSANKINNKKTLRPPALLYALIWARRVSTLFPASCAVWGTASESRPWERTRQPAPAWEMGHTPNVYLGSGAQHLSHTAAPHQHRKSRRSVWESTFLCYHGAVSWERSVLVLSWSLRLRQVQRISTQVLGSTGCPRRILGGLRRPICPTSFHQNRLSSVFGGLCVVWRCCCPP